LGVLKAGRIAFDVSASQPGRLTCSPIPCQIDHKIDSIWPKMNRHERGLEFKVGIFVFLGCAALAGLVVKFGRLGEGVKTYYELNVKFADASGLLKG